MQGLGGLAPGLNRGATMSGNKPGATSLRPLRFQYDAPNIGGVAGSAAFTAAEAGLYEVALWGAGEGDGTNAGAGAPLGVKRYRFSKGGTVNFLVGSPSTTPSVRISTATFPDGSVMTVEGGGGVVTGADAAVNGGPASGGVGGQAGSSNGYIGGLATSGPGGGGRSNSNTYAGAGRAMVVFLGP